LGLGAYGGDELVSLTVMVYGLDYLLEANGEEQTEGDGGDVDEEVAPRAGGVVGGVNVVHQGRSEGF
jgi:hypothetical protein